MAESYTHNNPSGSRLIVWYDTKAYEPENKLTRELLEGTLGKILIMNDEKEWYRLIDRDRSKQRLVLIISGELGEKIVPKIHHGKNILSIYIFCKNKQAHEEWVKEYSKVKSVTTTLEELIPDILSDPQIN